MTDLLSLELPAAYLDDLVEDEVPAVAGQTPVLINRDPEPAETRVARDTSIALEIATLDTSGSIDLTNTLVFVNGATIFDRGSIHSSFGGPASGYSTPQSDVLRIVLDPLVDFDSSAVVTVRVLTQAVGDTSVLDETYIFTCADTAAPLLSAAEGVDLQRVRVSFTEAVVRSAAANGALNPANWTLDRLGDYATPLVSATVVGAEEGQNPSTVELLTDIPLTPGGTYRLTAAGIEDENGNPVVDGFNVIEFTGWRPPAPAGRSFDLFKKLPEINRREDTSKDLYRFVACLQEVADLLLYDIDRFIEILDPDTAPESWVDQMLIDLGNPFAFDLTLTDKRRLAQVLVDMYRLKGTEVGIVNVVRFFLGLDVTLAVYNTRETWILGESEIGVDTFLGSSLTSNRYAFEASVDRVLTSDQRAKLNAIIDYMRPAHTHFIVLNEPEAPPEVIDHLELGISELGHNWLLH